MTRHILLVSLCAISALPMCLSAFFLGGRILIRKAMLEKLESAETVVLRLPSNGLHWYEKDHELLIDGRMFDVKSIRTTAHGYEVTGLFDDDETELFDQLEKTASGKKQSGGMVTSLFQSCLGIVGDIPIEIPMTTRIIRESRLQFPQDMAAPVLNVYYTPDCPPPDLIFLS